MKSLHSHTPDPDGRLTPCPQMRTLLSRLADGSLTGILRWYATAHTSRCARCAPALAGLQALRHSLAGLNAAASDAGYPDLHLSPERWSAIEEAMRTAEAATATSS